MSQPPTESWLKLSVIVPLYDKRVDEKDALRSWCESQDLPGDQFEVIVISDGSAPEAEERFVKCLRESDRIVVAKGANFAGLYHTGALTAKAPLLFFSELHCIANPDTLSSLLTYLAENPEFSGAAIHSRGDDSNTLSRVERQLFEGYMKEWSKPEHWKKVLVRGVAIERSAYDDAGGFDERYNHFADAALSARLFEKGYRLGYSEKSSLLHYYSTDIDQFIEPVITQTYNECEFRHQNSPVFCEKYFGTPPAWQERYTTAPRLAQLAATALEKTLDRHPDARTPAMENELREWESHTTSQCASRLNEARQHAEHMLQQCRDNFENEEVLLKIYPEAFAAYGAFQRMRFIQEVSHTEQPRLTKTNWFPMEEIKESQLAGFGIEEEVDGHAFRWSRAVGVVRVQIPISRYRLIIETRNIRPNPGEYLLDLYFNGWRLKNIDFSARDGSIVVNIPTFSISPFRFQKLCIVSRPWDLKDRPEGAPNIGMPVTGIRFETRYL